METTYQCECGWKGPEKDLNVKQSNGGDEDLCPRCGTNEGLTEIDEVQDLRDLVQALKAENEELKEKNQEMRRMLILIRDNADAFNPNDPKTLRVINESIK